MSKMDAVWLNAFILADVAGEEAALECEEQMLKIAGYDPFPACGFGWITVKPGNCSFAKWLKKTKGASSAHGGGVQLWVNKFGQSHDKKKAYARAFADKIENELILSQIAPNMTVLPGSRLD